MNSRPILMHARSIESLLAGRKTQTRRIIKPQPSGQLFSREGKAFWMPSAFSEQLEPLVCPHGAPGDLLWVRERHSFVEPFKSSGADPHWIIGVEYSDGTEKPTRFDRKPSKTRQRGEQGWLPSIHMPRRLSRLTLRLTDVRVERLNAISDHDCITEGVDVDDFRLPTDTALVAYRRIWEEIHGQFSWGDNPWVWALTFEVLRQNVDGVLKRVAA